MKRTRLMRRSPMRRSNRTSRYATRERDSAFMLFVKQQLCSVEQDWPGILPPTPCEGAIEADHMGDRGLSHKAADDTCAPMCTQHHRERTDHTGSFKLLTKAEVRAWRARQILRTQTNYAEHRGEAVTW